MDIIGHFIHFSFRALFISAMSFHVSITCIFILQCSYISFDSMYLVFSIHFLAWHIHSAKYNYNYYDNTPLLIIANY